MSMQIVCAWYKHSSISCRQVRILLQNGGIYPTFPVNEALSPQFCSPLVKGGYYEELVLSSLPPIQRREREELVCGTASALTDRQNRPAQALSVWSEGGEEQGEGRGRVWQHSLPVKVKESVCFEPHLEVESEVEPNTGGIQETGLT